MNEKNKLKLIYLNVRWAIWCGGVRIFMIYQQA